MSGDCPLPPSPPWAPGANPEHARILLDLRRARYPDCQRLSDGGVCRRCLHHVVGYHLPQAQVASQPRARGISPRPSQAARPRFTGGVL
jgi:hypothetical protein